MGAMIKILLHQFRGDFIRRTFHDLARILAQVGGEIGFLGDDAHRFPFPLLEPGGQRGNAQELAVWWTGEHTPKALTLPTENALADLFDTTAEDLLTSTSAGKSFWWAVSSEAGTTQLHCFSGLPPEDYFATMLENNIPARMPRLPES